VIKQNGIYGRGRYATFAQSCTDHLEESLNFQQACAALESLINSLPYLFSDVTVKFAFGENSPAIGDLLDPQNLGILATGDGVGSKSGVYFFGSPDGEIIYISERLPKTICIHRVWDHVRTPQVELDGRRIFPKHGFSERSYTPEQTACILGGDAFLGGTVSDPELISMVEVYLHTVHVKTHGYLPCLNKQIG
jgi:hypothetical protein